MPPAERVRALFVPPFAIGSIPVTSVVREMLLSNILNSAELMRVPALLKRFVKPPPALMNCIALVTAVSVSELSMTRLLSVVPVEAALSSTRMFCVPEVVVLVRVVWRRLSEVVPERVRAPSILPD